MFALRSPDSSPFLAKATSFYVSATSATITVPFLHRTPTVSFSTGEGDCDVMVKVMKHRSEGSPAQHFLLKPLLVL
jgi:hypothetical protein